MKIFQLTALALASTLLLAGCGSDNDSNIGSNNNSGSPSVPPKPPVNNNVTELNQAKDIIKTAQQFVLDNKAITDAYKGASDILTERQQQRINATFELPSVLYYYMKEKNITTLNAASINALAKNTEFNNYLNGITLLPKPDFVATINNKGQLSLTGASNVKTETFDYYDYVLNPQTGQYEPTMSTDNFDVVYKGFVDALTTTESATSFTGKFGFDSINIGSGADAVVFTSPSKGITVTGQFSDKVTVDDEFDLDDINSAGITLEKAVMKLGSVKVQANDSIIEAKDFELAFLGMSHKRADGQLVTLTLPTTIKLTGHLIKGMPATNASITLNAVANEADIKNIVKVTAQGNLTEETNRFVGMDVLLALKGTVAKKNGTTTATIPLDIQANLKRTARNVIELQGLSAWVDGKNLYVTGKTNLDANYNVVGSQLKITQNNAVIVLNVDANNEFIKDSMGKLSDIMVNGKDFGDLLENNGKLSAKFTDNSVIPLG
ncbi:hypothetical protein [Psychrobacter sp. 16-MNA-CIBAN-0192]|uniref:hypothetical protein n=1 Tax=Psychrobacter sp. 16-MNA-CIBAN-0192 TaxID=3140448 RepID=UPI0033337A83